jgi:hypothetical protein
MDQNVVNHVNGTCAAGTNVNGAGQTGSSVTVAAITGTLTKGTVVSFRRRQRGEPAIAPIDRRAAAVRADGRRGQRRDLAADLAGHRDLGPVPERHRFADQLVQAFTFIGGASATYATNVGFHRDAFTLAMVPMDAPMAAGGVDVSVMSDQGCRSRSRSTTTRSTTTTACASTCCSGGPPPIPELACKSSPVTITGLRPRLKEPS